MTITTFISLCFVIGASAYKSYNPFSRHLALKITSGNIFSHELSETFNGGNDTRNITEKFIDTYDFSQKYNSLTELRKIRISYFHPLNANFRSYAFDLKSGGLFDDFLGTMYDDHFIWSWDCDSDDCLL